MPEITRVLLCLMLLRRTKILNRKMVQELLFRHSDDSTVRDFLRKLVRAGFAMKHDIRNQFILQTTPYYTPTERGCVHLATETNDMAWLLDATPHFRVLDVPHGLGLSRLIVDLYKAVESQQYVQMPVLVREQCVINPHDADPEKRLRLHTEVREEPKRIVCIPDMGTPFRVGKFLRAVYWEYETGADGSPTRVAASKTPGYFWLNQSLKYQKHFPGTNAMTVVAVCPGAAFRESLRRAVRDAKPLQGADNGREMWLFADVNDLKPETILHAPVFYDCANKEPRPLINPPDTPPAEPPVLAPAQELVGGG